MSKSKSVTLAKREARAVKYVQATKVTRAGRPKAVRG